MEETADDFLRMILPTLGRMRESTEVLGRYARSSEHEEAAHEILTGLCNSIRMFQRVTLPQLLGATEPMPIKPNVDRAWLSDMGYNLDRALSRIDLDWPPPDQRHPPAIVSDLQDMYDRLAFRHTYLAPVNAETLMAVVNPVGEKACDLVDRRFPRPGLLPPSPKGKRRGRLITGLTSSAAILATAVGIAQLPQTVNEFPGEFEQFTHSIEHVATLAGNNAMDLGFEIRDLFDKSNHSQWNRRSVK